MHVITFISLTICVFCHTFMVLNMALNIKDHESLHHNFIFSLQTGMADLLIYFGEYKIFFIFASLAVITQAIILQAKSLKRLLYYGNQ